MGNEAAHFGAPPSTMTSTHPGFGKNCTIIIIEAPAAIAHIEKS